MMNILNNRHSRRFIVLGLVFFVSIFFVSSTLASEDVCERAMSRCTADAVKAGLLSGAQSFFLYYAACFMGYSWCLKYYVPQN